MIEVSGLSRPLRQHRGGESRLASAWQRGDELRPRRRERAPANPPCCARSPGSTANWTGRDVDRRAVRLEAAAQQGLLPPRADGVPGPLRLAASAPDRRSRCSPSRCWCTAWATSTRASAAASPRWRLPPAVRFRYPASALRRPAPARGDRARADGGAGGAAARRAHQRARRLGAGRGAEPAGRSAARARPDLHHGQPQSRGGRASLRARSA